MSAVPAATGRRGRDLRRLPLRYLVVSAIVPIALLAVLAIVLLARLPAASPALVGTIAPDFTVADLDGNPIRLADLRGRPVVVNFWASWCGPCVEEFPLLADAAKRHGAGGLAIVGIVYQDRSEAARTFMLRNGASWPAAMDPGERVAAAYGILAPPETFFIGRDGTIVARHIGQLSANTLADELASIIDEE
jgi:cytochrome c biogenesis protein CcmG, thiol:disulfide interchange protein DsbE